MNKYHVRPNDNEDDHVEFREAMHAYRFLLWYIAGVVTLSLVVSIVAY